MEIAYHRTILKTKTLFRISRDAYSQREILVVRISADGQHGYGELSEHPYYKSDINAQLDQLKSLRDNFPLTFTSAAQFLEAISAQHLHPFLLSALDTAAHDLEAKTKNISIAQLLKIKQATQANTMYTIGMDGIKKMQQDIIAHPWPLYKIKLGNDKVIETISALRDVTSSAFCIDANCSWTKNQLLAFTQRLAELNVLFIEEPLGREKSQETKDVLEDIPIPIVADESCCNMDDLKACLGGYHGINIKLMKVGGYRKALEMMELAQKEGMFVMGGCMMESSIGISHLAQVCSDMKYLDMDSNVLIANDIAEGAMMQKKSVRYGNGPGLAAEIHDTVSSSFHTI